MPRAATTIHNVERPRELTRAQLRAAIARLIKKWSPRLGLDQWALQIEYDDDLEVEAECQARPRYEEATLIWNLPRILMISARAKSTLEELVVHEMVHCIAWPASEAVVSRIARALIRTEVAVRGAHRRSAERRARG